MIFETVSKIVGAFRFWLKNAAGSGSLREYNVRPAYIGEYYQRPKTFHQIGPTRRKAIRLEMEQIKPIFHHSG